MKADVICKAIQLIECAVDIMDLKVEVLEVVVFGLAGPILKVLDEVDLDTGGCG